MASCFRIVCAKNRQNPLILFKVTIDNVGVPFLRHSVFSQMSYQLSNQETEFHPGQATTMLGILKYPDDFSKAQGLNQLCLNQLWRIFLL